MNARQPDFYRRALEGLLGVPATEGNDIQVLRNGDEIFPAMLEAIDGSQHTIDLQTFVYWTGTIAQKVATALAERARQGVRVRVLLDAVGAGDMNEDLIERMRSGGVQVEFFRASPEPKVWKYQNRTHRKVLVCDETVGFTGGVGIAREWEGDARDHTEWRDTHFRIEGPAINGLRASFLANWAETGRPLLEEVDRLPVQPQPGSCIAQVIRSDPNAEWTNIEGLFRYFLLLAQHRIRISTAYFAPDDKLTELLCEAANRGVEIDVLLPGPHTDKRVARVAAQDTFAPLLKAGIRIRTFRPTMLHTKIVLVDDVVSCVGSANFNSRSMMRDYETAVIAFDRKLTGTLNEHLEEDITRADTVDHQAWRNRGAVQRIKETAVNLIDDHI